LDASNVFPTCTTPIHIAPLHCWNLAYVVKRGAVVLHTKTSLQLACPDAVTWAVETFPMRKRSKEHLELPLILFGLPVRIMREGQMFGGGNCDWHTKLEQLDTLDFCTRRVSQSLRELSGPGYILCSQDDSFQVSLYLPIFPPGIKSATHR
jgi:hypothetical protein